MKRLVFAVLLLSAMASGQATNVRIRYGAATSQSNTGTLPTANPFPLVPPNPTSNPPNNGGQSQGVAGALNLAGCGAYDVTIYAGAGCTLNNVGTEQVSYWSNGAPSTVAGWSRNLALDEQHSTQPSGVSSHHFPSHSSAGVGWVQVTPSGVTQVGGCTTVTTLIEASLCGS